MKKILLTILLFLFPLIVSAEGIENYYINATIENNGDLLVEEYFYLNDEFNGMSRIINYRNSNAFTFNKDSSSYGGSNLHNGKGVEILEVRALKIDSEFDFSKIEGTVFNKASYASVGDFGVYTVDDEYDGVDLRIYLPSSKNKAFYIKYRLRNMGILHNDIGELGWNVVGNSLSESVANLVVYINIPNNKNITKVWAHGPYHGESKIISKDKVMASIHHLDSYTSVDVRVAFDKSVISNSSKTTNVNALDKIIKYETDEAEKANYERDKYDEININYINNYFDLLDKTPSRSTYDILYDYIYNLYNVTIREEYFNKLFTYQDKVDNYEYGVFKSYLISGYYSYQYYENALEVVNNVFSEELRNKMNTELEIYLKELKKTEIKREINISVLALLTVLFTYVMLKLSNYLRKNKKYKVDPEYFRDIPSNLSPECAGLLIDGSLTGDELSAGLLDLIRRKVVTFEKKENGSYELSHETGIYNNLSVNDKNVIEMIFGKSYSVNTKKIKKIKYDDYEDWKKKTIKTLENKSFIKKYKESNSNGTLLMLGIIFSFTPLFFVGFILLSIYLIGRYKAKIFIWLLIPFNIILIVFSAALNHFYHTSIIICLVSMFIIKKLLKRFAPKMKIKYTNEGVEEANKWRGLKNFLMDFSTISEREIPEVELWEKYLVYATSFGIGKEVLNAMKVKIESANIDTSALDTFVLASNISELSNITSSLNSVGNTINSYGMPKVDMPEGGSSGGSWGSSGGYSSGGGGGGGFSGGSSGGGSFGGGGGGGRF